MTQKTISFIERLIKGFGAGFISAMVLQLSTATTIASWQQFSQFQISLLIGGLVGGLMAIEKMFNWTSDTPVADSAAIASNINS